MSPRYPFMLGHKVQKVQKHISDDQVTGVSLLSIECPPSSY